MNILFITDCFPYPLYSGGKIVTYQMLLALAVGHRIHLICPYLGKRPPSSAVQAFKLHNIEVTLVEVPEQPPKQTSLERIQEIALLQPIIPYQIYQMEPLFQKAVSELLSSHSFDIIHVDHLYMAQYFPKRKSQTWILSHHNIEYKFQQSFSKMVRKKRKPFFWYNAFTLWLKEKKTLSQMDQVVVLSEEDKQCVMEMGVSSAKILIFTPGQEIVPRRMQKQTNKLFFIGNIWWEPNFDAMSWFIQNVYPQLQKRVSSISLRIVGEDSDSLSPLVKAFPAIELIGQVKKIDEYLDGSTIFILPFRIGEGVRIKALTALAHDLPIISTKVGVKGLAVQSGKHYLEANTAADFVSQITVLLENPKQQERLILAGKRYLKQKHNPRKIAQFFLKAYARV